MTTLPTLDAPLRTSPERELVPSIDTERSTKIHSRLHALSDLSDDKRTTIVQFLLQQRTSEGEIPRDLYLLASAATAIDKGHFGHARSCIAMAVDAEASDRSARLPEWDFNAILCRKCESCQMIVGMSGFSSF